jgi:hypothetical protein
LISTLGHRSLLLGIVILILDLTFCLFLDSYILSNTLRIRLVGNAIRVAIHAARRSAPYRNIMPHTAHISALRRIVHVIAHYNAT